MRPSSALVLLLLAGVMPAQVITSPPPICFAYNDTSPPGPGNPPFQTAYATYFGSLWVHFSPPVTAAIEVIHVWGATGCICNVPLQATFDVYPTPALGVQPTTPSLGTFSGSFNGMPSWYAFQPSTAIPLTGGATYAFFVRGYPAVPNSSQYAFACVPIPYDPAGPTQLIYQFVGTPACPGGNFASSGTIGLMIRFRGTSCGPGPPASIGPLGTACGGGMIPAGLTSFTPPVLGSLWPLNVSGPAGETAMLFWSGGVNPGGTVIAAGSSCLFYLDPASVTSLASMGVEPLVTAVLPTPFPFPTWTFPVPPFPAYAGFVMGVQVAIVGPTGTIPLGGGAFFQTTNALQLTLGY